MGDYHRRSFSFATPQEFRLILLVLPTLETDAQQRCFAVEVAK